MSVRLHSHLRFASALVACAIAGAMLASPLAAQGPRPSDPPAADGSHDQDKHGQPAANDPEARKRFREMLTRRLETRKRELDSLERAVKLFDQGKTLEELRTLLPDLPRFGQRGEDRDQWQPRMDQWGAGRSPDSADPNRPGPGPRSQEPRVLTEEDRAAIREVLAATAPEMLTKLRELEKTEPAKADQQYTRSLDRMRYLLDLRKRDAPMFELKAKEIRHGFEAMALARAIGEIDKAPTPDTAVRQQKVELLRAALLAQYNVRTQIMQREVDHSAERAAEMAKEIEKRPSQAAEAVEKNVRDMIDREKRRRDRQNNGDGGRPGPDHHGAPPPSDSKPGEPPRRP